ncbi:MAG: hypothetical protein KJ970_02475 [Candidatus Eisenbacteria bacterium]|uniref:Uncharacterized protein n=1 Tax=Eiseniibacteriota bacterium TaxID=2212470 RepID=A0A948RWX9_UNCEI|nr:hypothetical protein [Candidatus Eisenbacteria bacterium]MBU1949104.1 hypothetical protein [Candidatus Eisenbacteria bacterium]MBU2689764.1 hypothetical protein [Candidatus Eisenbacteria bacterium]
MMKSSALPISIACLTAFMLGCEKTDDVLTPQPYEPAELSGTAGPAGSGADGSRRDQLQFLCAAGPSDGGQSG